MKLTTPENYFNDSYRKTMDSVNGIRRRRKRTVMVCALIILVAGICFTLRSFGNFGMTQAEKEYLALQRDEARLDIFLEINQ